MKIIMILVLEVDKWQRNILDLAQNMNILVKLLNIMTI